MAERVGFEPTVEFPPHSLSRRALSTAQTPLLKSDSGSYARNLYRLGFVLAKMQRIPEARATLTEAVAINSPYRALAQDVLNRIGGPIRR